VAGHTIPFFVTGNGGYWNLHHVGAAPGYINPETEAKLVAWIDSRHGFMTFEINDKVINGHFTTVPRPQASRTDAQAYNAHFDVFSYTAAPLFLPEEQTVTLVPQHGAQSQAKVAARAAHAARTARKIQGSHAARSGRL
jgi:hypothetical protein